MMMPRTRPGHVDHAGEAKAAPSSAPAKSGSREDRQVARSKLGVTSWLVAHLSSGDLRESARAASSKAASKSRESVVAVADGKKKSPSASSLSIPAAPAAAPTAVDGAATQTEPRTTEPPKERTVRRKASKKLKGDHAEGSGDKRKQPLRRKKGSVGEESGSSPTQQDEPLPPNRAAGSKMKSEDQPAPTQSNQTEEIAASPKNAEPGRVESSTAPRKEETAPPSPKTSEEPIHEAVKAPSPSSESISESKETSAAQKSGTKDAKSSSAKSTTGAKKKGRQRPTKPVNPSGSPPPPPTTPVQSTTPRSPVLPVRSALKQPTRKDCTEAGPKAAPDGKATVPPAPSIIQESVPSASAGSEVILAPEEPSQETDPPPAHPQGEPAGKQPDEPAPPGRSPRPESQAEENHKRAPDPEPDPEPDPDPAGVPSTPPLSDSGSVRDTVVRFGNKPTVHRLEVPPGRRLQPIGARYKTRSRSPYLAPLDPKRTKDVFPKPLRSPQQLKRHKKNQKAMARYWARTEQEEAEWRAEAERRAEEAEERYRAEPPGSPGLADLDTVDSDWSKVSGIVVTEVRIEKETERLEGKQIEVRCDKKKKT